MSHRLFAALFAALFAIAPAFGGAPAAAQTADSDQPPMNLLEREQAGGIGRAAGVRSNARESGHDGSPSLSLAPPAGTKAEKRATLQQRIRDTLETLASPEAVTGSALDSVNATGDGPVMRPVVQPAEDAPAKTHAAPPPAPDTWLVNIPEWRGDRTFAAGWRLRQRNLDQNKPGATRTYARFAFAWGLLSEARSQIGAFEDDTVVHLLHLLAGDQESAERVLSLATKENSTDAALWRAVALPVAQPRRPAIPDSQAVIDGLTHYGAPLGRRLALRAMEIYARTGDLNSVAALSGWLEAIVLTPAESARLNRLRGDAHAARGDLEAAQDYWNRSAMHGDTPDGVRATRNLIEAKLATGDIDRETAMTALEALAYRWRGDGMTAALHTRLAQWRWQRGDILGALEVLQQGIARSGEQGGARLMRLAGSRLSQIIRMPESEDLPAADYVALLPDFADLLGQRRQAPLGRAYIDTLLRLEHPEQAEKVASLLGLDGPEKAENASHGRKPNPAQPKPEPEVPRPTLAPSPQSAAQVTAALGNSRRILTDLRERFDAVVRE